MALRPQADDEVLSPIYETVRRVKAELPKETTLIGFCGAPWTVATYMVAGRGTPDQAPAKELAARDPAAFQHLVDCLVEASVGYLARQLEAGAEVVQIFDTWAGSLPPEGFERWCVQPTKKLVAKLREKKPGVRVIGFPRGAGPNIPRYVEETGVDAVSLESEIDRTFAREQIQSRVPVQGNVDPQILLAGGEALDREVDAVLEAFGGGPHIFNLGHGILPPDPDRPCGADAQARARITSAMYLWIKAFHIIAVIAWMAGMLYLPRLFVYHAVRQARLRELRDLQGHGAPAAALHHDPGDDRDLAARAHPGACRASGWAPAGSTPSSPWC